MPVWASELFDWPPALEVVVVVERMVVFAVTAAAVVAAAVLLTVGPAVGPVVEAVSFDVIVMLPFVSGPKKSSLVAVVAVVSMAVVSVAGVVVVVVVVLVVVIVAVAVVVVGVTVVLVAVVADDVLELVVELVEVNVLVFSSVPCASRNCR